MTTSLPPRPDLGHLKRQAKSLLKAQKDGNPQVCQVLRQLHRFNRSSDSEILAADVKLSDVQFALALDYGFSSWDALKHYVDGMTVNGDEAIVHRRDGEAWIDGIPKLTWTDPGDCTFVGALLRALNRIGEPINYVDLMGISGAAFRFCFAHPNWDFSSVDGMLGYDHGQAAADALGYEVSWAEEDQMRDAFVRSIEQGRPALGIDLLVAPEWGVIAGYADGGKTLLCRTYFDEPGEEYARTERLPWLNYIIGDRKPARTRRESLLESLRIAVLYAHAEGFTSFGGGVYKRGLEGLEAWIGDLLDEARFDPSDQDLLQRHADVNRFIFNALLDARGAAARYLSNHSDLLGPGLRGTLQQLAGVYGQITGLLREAKVHVTRFADDPKSDGLDLQDWTPEERRAQADALGKALVLERTALRLSEQILASVG
jgi:hypothetical protein